MRGLTRHGAATRPATFPPLLDLAERAKEATRRENENGRDHATAPIVSRLLRAIEDVFSSPGMLSDGFATHTGKPPWISSEEMCDLVDEYKERHVTIHTLGFQGADVEMMKAVAARTGGRYSDIQ